nr:hypothetical protein [Erwinia rhapontici]
MGNTHRLYTTALVGFGPANLGLLLSAYRKNKLSEIAKNGIAIFEKSPRLGAGKLGYYQITANSLSSVFLECIDDPRFYELTSDFIGGDALTFLRDYPDTAPQLSLVADLLERLAEKIISRLAEKYQITLYREAEVTQIKRSGRVFLFLLTIMAILPRQKVNSCSPIVADTRRLSSRYSMISPPLLSPLTSF